MYHTYVDSHWDEAVQRLATADVIVQSFVYSISFAFAPSPRSQGEVCGGGGRDDGAGRRKQQLLAEERRRLPDGNFPWLSIPAYLGRQTHHAGAVLPVVR